MGIRGLAAAVLAVVAMVALAGGPAHADPSGTWLTPAGDAKVHITRCVNSYCGTVVWQKTPRKDTRNPNPAKRDRAVIGIQMIYGMKPSGASQWTAQLYNPGNGKTVTADFTMDGDNKMKLKGCAMGGFFCKSQVWKRSN